MNTEERNCLSYWFPLIRDAGLPVPRTEVFRTSCQLLELLDGNTPLGCEEFDEGLLAIADKIGYPCFLRTGHTSNKHDWRRTCYVERPKDLNQHVFNLVEFSACQDLSTDVWVVRELIPTTPAFHAFRGMPIVREFRVFTKAGESVCIHPYWPPGSIREPSIDQWRSRLDRMSGIDEKASIRLGLLAVVAEGATDFNDWSVDFLQDAKGDWWLTDMAKASRSYHWPDCPNAGTH